MEKHYYYMAKALELSRKALSAGEFPVGCVIVDEEGVVAEGSRCNSGGEANEIDHAEIIALRSLLSLGGSIDFSKLTIYSTMEPCLMCFSTIIVNGITRIVYGYEDAMGGGTNLPLEKLAPLYRDLELKITAGVLREECLGQFKSFFESPDNVYLKGTYLETYTLQQ